MLAQALTWIARQGRYALIIGLAIGIAVPKLAAAMQPMIAPLVVLLLFLAVLRLGPEGLRTGLRHESGGVGAAVALILLLQLALPLMAIALLSLWGGLTHPLALGLVLILAAAPITGSPHITVMVGGDPGPALTQLVVGTALLPLTALPVFWLIPAFGSPTAVAGAVLQLLGLILAAGGAALALRHWRVVGGSAEAIAVVDGLAAIGLGVVVIGLMSAVGPAIAAGGTELMAAMAMAFLTSYGLQIATAGSARLAGRRHSAPALGVAAGNRNVALFLSILPADTAASVLLVIGCWQIPMYLTPVLLSWFYTQRA